MAYGNKGERTLKLFEGDDHALWKSSLEAEGLLCKFIAKCLGAAIKADELAAIVGKPLVVGQEKVKLMEQAGDLRGTESVE